MSIISKVMKAGVAKKAIDEAKKPKNQAKIKSMVSKFTGGRSSGRTASKRAPKPRSTGYR